MKQCTWVGCAMSDGERAPLEGFLDVLPTTSLEEAPYSLLIKLDRAQEMNSVGTPHARGRVRDTVAEQPSLKSWKFLFQVKHLVWLSKVRHLKGRALKINQNRTDATANYK